MQSGNKSCSCPTNHKVRIKNPHYPLLGSLLIALIPKCPFCLMAYTSAITVCSSKTLTEYSPQWTSWISISFAVLTLGFVLWNFKGIKTMVAGLLILAGLLLIVRSELLTGMLTSYYGGCALLFAGVWLNGSLLYFVKLIFGKKTERPVQLWPR